MNLGDILVQDSNIIFTTPEKWDSVTRRWRDHSVSSFLKMILLISGKALLKQIRLLLIDEVHLVGDERGQM